MEQQIGNNLIEEPKKSGRGQYERSDKRGSYKKHKIEKKVTVSHFLNTKINFAKSAPMPFDDENSHRYPLYVKVIFNKKTAVFRSLTENTFNGNEDFKNLEYDFVLKDILERERRFIKYYFTNRYSKYLRDNSLDETFAIKNYDDNKMFFKKEYYHENELDKVIDYTLKMQLYDFAKELTIEKLEREKGKGFFNDLDEDYTNFDLLEQMVYQDYYPIAVSVQHPSNTVKALELLNFYEFRNPRFKEMKERFPSEIWHFNIFYSRFVELKSSYSFQLLGATIIDYLEGDFKSKFLKYSDEYKSEIKKIIVDIDKLTSDILLIS